MSGATLNTEPLRFSDLKRFALESPAHYKSGGAFSSAALQKGTATHALALGTREVIAYEDGPRRGKAYEAFKAAHPDAEILTPAAYLDAKAMADALHGNKWFAEALRLARKHGGVEQTHFWTDCGVRCRGTPDLWSPGVIGDIKSTRSAHPDRFARDAFRLAYGGQLAGWYGEGLRQLGVTNATQYLLFAVESRPPYVVTTFRLTPEAIDASVRLVRSWFERYRVWLENGALATGYSEAIVDLDVPDDRSLLVFGGDGDGEEVEEARDAV